MFLLVSFRGQNKLEPRPFQYLLGVKTKIARRASPSFLYGSPPPSTGTDCSCLGDVEGPSTYSRHIHGLIDMLLLRPFEYLLGVKTKSPDEHPRHFYMGLHPPPG